MAKNGHKSIYQTGRRVDVREESVRGERRGGSRKNTQGITAKKILRAVAVTGLVIVACQSPYFIRNVMKHFFRERRFKDARERRRVHDAFTYLRRRGYVRMEYRGRQLHISLTREGKKYAGRFQIDDLAIAQPPVWDRQWRILLFDVPHVVRVKREALRGKLKEFGFYQFQKSVWVHPYPCDRELGLLSDFFGFTPSHYCLLVTSTLGPREREVREYFGLMEG